VTPLRSVWVVACAMAVARSAWARLRVIIVWHSHVRRLTTTPSERVMGQPQGSAGCVRAARGQCGHHLAGDHARSDTAGLRAALQGFLDTKGTIAIVSTSTVVKGDLALTHSHWRLDTPAGEPMEHTSAEAVASRAGPGSTPSTIPMGRSPRLIASALPHARAIDDLKDRSAGPT
jgi:hypothetical protein